MNTTLHRRIAMAICFAVLVMLALAVSPAWAQGPETTPVTAAATPTAEGTAVEITRLPPQLNAADLLWIIIITFLFALLSWGILFIYTYRIQNTYYDLVGRLARGGTTVETTITGDVSAPRGVPGVLGADEQAAGRVDGPDVVTIGALSAEFRAIGPNGQPVAVKWSVEPSNVALVNPENGQATKVFPAIGGVFTLTATDTTNSPAVTFPPKKVAAVAQQTNKVQLPFIGRGYGAIAITIILFAIILILGLSSVLPAAAIAPLLGTLVGYIFGTARQAEPNQNSNEEGGK